MNDLISVVIPAYNAASFIERTAESIRNQTYTDWELIIVNDGSTDATGNLIDSLAAQDKRIKAIHQPNGGEVSARRTGVLHATGKWVMFVDADDVLPAASMESLITLETDADIRVGTMHVYYVDDAGKTYYDFVFQNTRTGEMDGCSFAAGVFLKEVQMTVCSKLYKRTLFENFHWCLDKRIRMNPDLLMNIGIGAGARKVCVSNEAVCYDYIIHQGSVSTSAPMPYTGWFLLFDQAEKYIEDYEKSKMLAESYCHYRLGCFDLMIRHGIIGFSSDDRHVKKTVSDSHKLILSVDEAKVVFLLKHRMLRKLFWFWQRLRGRK